MATEPKRLSFTNCRRYGVCVQDQSQAVENCCFRNEDIRRKQYVTLAIAVLLATVTMGEIFTGDGWIKNFEVIGSNWNENTEKNYKQNKDGQNKKRKNTGNMWDPKHNIVGTKETRRTEWSIHISRMAEDRLVRRVHDGIPQGNRNWGRPMKRWRDALE